MRDVPPPGVEEHPEYTWLGRNRSRRVRLAAPIEEQFKLIFTEPARAQLTLVVDLKEQYQKKDLWVGRLCVEAVARTGPFGRRHTRLLGPPESCWSPQKGSAEREWAQERTRALLPRARDRLLASLDPFLASQPCTRPSTAQPGTSDSPRTNEKPPVPTRADAAPTDTSNPTTPTSSDRGSRSPPVVPPNRPRQAPAVDWTLILLGGGLVTALGALTLWLRVRRGPRIDLADIPPGHKHLEEMVRQANASVPFHKGVMVMMKFPHPGIDADLRQCLIDLYEAIRVELARGGLVARRADDQHYAEYLRDNVIVYQLACKYGLAVFDHSFSGGTNPNVSHEHGSMKSFGRKVGILCEQGATVSADFVGLLRHDFVIHKFPSAADPSRLEHVVDAQSVHHAVAAWMRGLGL